MSSSSSSSSASSQRAISTSPEYDLKHPQDVMRIIEEDDQYESSHSSNSRGPTPDSDSDMYDSEVEQQGPLPSCGELWNGRLPSGSGLDSTIRNLGIGHPLPPVRPLSLPSAASSYQGRSGRPPSPSPRNNCLLDPRPPPATSFPPSLENPYQLWRSRSPLPAWSPRRSIPSPGRLYSVAREGRKGYSVDSDSDDGCPLYQSSSLRRPMERSYSMHQAGGRVPSQHSGRANSYDSDLDYPISRPTSVHSYSSDRPPYHPSSSYSDYGPSTPDTYGASEGHDASENWEDYVEKAGRVNGTGPVMYTCMWRKHEGEHCNYTGKKQLAKRHVESVHLGKKPHVCPQCRKPFPQKTSLDIHIRSVHTFQKPLKCEHCEACFSDPARRHKHYRVEHPDKVVKKTRVKIDYQDIKHLLKK